MLQCLLAPRYTESIFFLVPGHTDHCTTPPLNALQPPCTPIAPHFGAHSVGQPISFAHLSTHDTAESTGALYHRWFEVLAPYLCKEWAASEALLSLCRQLW